MPNIIAYIALLMWPLAALWLFTKRPPAEAALLTLLGGLLLLPVRVEIDAPILDLNKGSVSSLAALFACVYIARQKIKLIPVAGLEKWFVLVIFISPIFTTLTNQDAYGFNNGLTFYDAFVSMVNGVVVVIPFLLGLQLIKSHDDHVVMLKLIVIAGAIYSLPILWEVRMSPQLHTQFYGFFPHSFSQQVRAGGFRAVVFLGHGLYVAMFVVVALGAAVLLWKEKAKIYNYSAIIFVVFLFLILLSCKSLGPLIFGVSFVAIVAWMPFVITRYAAISLSTFVILYPALCVMNIFPHEALVDLMASNFGADRAGSLDFRFMNERVLLEHVQDKIWFGWGGWGRFLPPGTVIDGTWIGLIGSAGIVGFGAIFGLMALSVSLGVKASKITRYKNERNILLGHAFLIAIIMLDQIPNSSLGGMGFFLWFLVGSLLARSRKIIKNKNQAGHIV